MGFFPYGVIWLCIYSLRKKCFELSGLWWKYCYNHRTVKSCGAVVVLAKGGFGWSPTTCCESSLCAGEFLASDHSRTELLKELRDDLSYYFLNEYKGKTAPVFWQCSGPMIRRLKGHRLSNLTSDDVYKEGKLVTETRKCWATDNFLWVAFVLNRVGMKSKLVCPYKKLFRALFSCWI